MNDQLVKVLTVAAAVFGILSFFKKDAEGGVTRTETGVDGEIVLEAKRYHFPDDSVPSFVSANECADWIQKYKLAWPKYFSFLSTEIVLGVIRQESSLNPRSRGGAGEMGLMQVKKETWHETAKNYSAGTGLDFDVLINPNPWQTQILIGMLYLYEVSRLIKTDQLEWVLQAYNVGPTAFLQGTRNPAYAQGVLGWAGVYHNESYVLPTATVGPLNAINQSPSGDVFL